MLGHDFFHVCYGDIAAISFCEYLGIAGSNMKVGKMSLPRIHGNDKKTLRRSTVILNDDYVLYISVARQPAYADGTFPVDKWYLFELARRPGAAPIRTRRFGNPAFGEASLWDMVCQHC